MNSKNNLLITLVISIVFFISLSKGELLSQLVITEGLETPNYASDVLFYNDNLVVVVGVRGGSSETQASLIQYDSNGQIARSLSFPIFGEDVEIEPLNIHENLLYIIVYNEDGYGISFNVYEVDLESFIITNENSEKPPQRGEDGHTPDQWFPFSATQSYWKYTDNLGLITLFPFSLEDLTEGKEGFVLPFNFANIGGATDPVSAENLLFMCGVKNRIENLDVFFVNYDVEKKEIANQWRSSNADCGIVTFLGNTSQVAYASNVVRTPNLNLAIFDVLDPTITGTNVNGTTVLQHTELLRMYADQSNIFLMGKVQKIVNGHYYFNNYNTTIFQIQYNEADNSFTIIDQMNPPTGYTIDGIDREHYNPMLSYALGSKQFAVILETVEYITDYSGVLLVNYD